MKKSFHFIVLIAFRVFWFRHKMLKYLVRWLVRMTVQPFPVFLLWSRVPPLVRSPTLMVNIPLMSLRLHNILVFSFVGMFTQEVSIDGRTIIDVALETDAIGIDEVVVTAYGTKRKGGLTGSVSVVESEAFDSKPISSFDQMIQGTSPGVQVVTRTGAPGSTALINIRGIGSISAGNEPLFVIDGVPVQSNSFTELNPNDIESISILKDAAAASLYGSRASNGVILVTSKRGRAGDSKIDIRYRRGLNVMNQAIV